MKDLVKIMLDCGGPIVKRLTQLNAFTVLSYSIALQQARTFQRWRIGKEKHRPAPKHRFYTETEGVLVSA